MSMRRALAAAIVVVLAGTVMGSSARSALAAVAPVPRLAAPAAILIEPVSGDIVYQHRARQRRRMASTTKLMTALLTLERRGLSERIAAVSYAAQPAESVIGLRAGERLTVADLLRGLLLASANDAAATLAHGVGGSTAGFVALMNQRARQLGLRRTHFANPVGLDAPGNFSTAADLAALAQVVRRNAFAREVMDRPGAILRSGGHVRRIANRNTLVRDVSWMTGVKTGHTANAGYVLIGSASRGGVQLVSVVMGDPSEGARNIDTLTLLNYGFSRYHRVRVVTAGAPVASARVKDQDATVELVAPQSLRVVLRRGVRAQLVVQGVPREVDGPLARGTRLGTLLVRSGGRTLARSALVTRTAVARASLWQHNAWMLPLLAVFAAASSALLALASLRRASRRRARRRARRSRSEIA